jgi:preprotein translocase subunit SecE
MQNPVTAIISYIRSSIAELKKVTWPTKDQTVRYVSLVIAVSVAIAAFFASLDLGFSRGIMYAISKTPHSSALPAEAPITPDLQETPDVETQQPAETQTINVTPAGTDDQGQTPTIELPAETPIELPKN